MKTPESSVTIRPNQPLITLITIHVCAAENQAALAALLTSALESTYSRQPGFVSASIHLSTDGTRVTNYAQWRSVTDYEALREMPSLEAYRNQVKGLVTTYDDHLYEVSSQMTAQLP